MPGQGFATLHIHLGSWLGLLDLKLALKKDFPFVEENAVLNAFLLDLADTQIWAGRGDRNGRGGLLRDGLEQGSAPSLGFQVTARPILVSCAIAASASGPTVGP